MAQAHGGRHMPATGNRRALKIAAWLTGTYFFVELAIGLWTGSVAVTSDAFHTFSAVGGVLLALAAMHVGEWEATESWTFGWKRAEIIGALFNGLFLVGMALLVLWMGAMRLMEPIELPPGPMLAAAAGGIVTELIALKLMFQGQKGDLNMKGAFWHIVQTFVGSAIIIVTAVVIYFTGFYAIDPILGMAFGLVLFWASWKILRDSLAILLQGTPEDFDMEAALGAIRNVEGVADVHHVHAWSLTSGRNIFTGHVRVQDGHAGQRVLQEVSELLRERFGIYFSTIQIEERRLGSEQGAEKIDITQAGQRRPEHAPS